jgi:BNR repeat protein
MFIALAAAMMFLQGGNGGFPAIAADAGRVHVVWQDDTEGNHEIYYSHSTDSGSFTPALNISHNPGTSDLPRIVVQDKAVDVVWSDTSGGMYQVMLAQSQDGGQTFGAARALSDGKGSSGPPDIARQDGQLFVVWDETDNDGGTRIVYWDSTGSRRAIAGSNHGLVPSVAVRGKRVVIAWHNDIDYKQHVYVAQSNDFGKSFSEPVLVSGDFQRSETASVGIAPGGRCFIAWSDRTSGRSEIFVSMSDSDGENYSAPKVVASPARESTFPDLQVINDDEIAIAWLARGAIVYARMSAAGAEKEPARNLANSESAGVPRLAFSDGIPIVVWKDFGLPRSPIFISRDKAPGKRLF